MSVSVAPSPWDMVRRASWAIRWMPGERNSCSAVKRATDCGPGTVDTLATAFFCWVIPLPLKVIRYTVMASSAIIGRRRVGCDVVGYIRKLYAPVQPRRACYYRGYDT